jgi:tRNA G18 (ribose-2'-O)-methylase SpoU
MEISSLNVAAAAAITLYEFRRQHPAAETEA